MNYEAAINQLRDEKGAFEETLRERYLSKKGKYE